MPIILFLLKRWADSSKKTADAGPRQPALSAEGSSTRKSQADSGVGIAQNINAPTFNVNIAQPAAIPARPSVPQKVEETLPNIRYISAAPVSLRENPYSGLEEEGSAQNALIIRFANEARQGTKNLTARVKAVLIYRYGQNEIDLAGSWLHEGSDVSDFEPDSRRHILIAGVVVEGEFGAITGRRFVSHRRNWYLADRYPLKGFQDGILFVQLTDVHTRRLLFQGEFTISVNPLSIAPTNA